MNNNDGKIKLELTEREFSVICNALDIYSETMFKACDEGKKKLEEMSFISASVEDIRDIVGFLESDLDEATTALILRMQMFIFSTKKEP